MADVADKIVKQLTDETRKMRDLAAISRDANRQNGSAKPDAVASSGNTVGAKQ
jgi:hypothetical protein